MHSFGRTRRPPRARSGTRRRTFGAVPLESLSVHQPARSTCACTTASNRRRAAARWSRRASPGRPAGPVARIALTRRSAPRPALYGATRSSTAYLARSSTSPPTGWPNPGCRRDSSASPAARGRSRRLTQPGGDSAGRTAFSCTWRRTRRRYAQVVNCLWTPRDPWLPRERDVAGHPRPQWSLPTTPCERDPGAEPPVRVSLRPPELCGGASAPGWSRDRRSRA